MPNSPSYQELQSESFKLSTQEVATLSRYSTVTGVLVCAQAVFIPELGIAGSALAGVIGIAPLAYKFFCAEENAKGFTTLISTLILSPLLGLVIDLLMRLLKLNLI